MIEFALVLVFLVLLPLTALHRASEYRRSAQADLASARQLEAEVAGLAAKLATAAEPILSDGTVQSAAVIAAQEQGLTVARFTPAGPDRLRLMFEASDSRAVTRWLDRMVRSGFDVSATQMTRVGDTELVTAEFDVGAGS